ncbi:hypothetical protein J437_LFUL005034 [Ladona fulva]|uniref:Uncharacterized protein n=1 Tax=Ladona fulva TaxID=123851 RepID=A0A8K0NUY4_LADFU|nr:hypothetical protein J437_LFUL005034 [Ladona fulva]
MPEEDAFAPYRVSYLWHSFLATAITITVGMLFSILYKVFISSNPPEKDEYVAAIPPIVKNSVAKNNMMHVRGLAAKAKGATTMEEEAIRNKYKENDEQGQCNPSFVNEEIFQVEKYTYKGDQFSSPS